MANINLMSEKKPTKVKKKASAPSGESQAPVIIFALIVAVTLAGLVFWWLRLNGQISDLNKKIGEAEIEKKRLEAIIQQVQEFQRQKELLERKINIIDELKAKQSGPVHLLDEISTAVPEYLWLTELKEVGKEIQMKGQATNIIAITNFVGNMERSPWFKNVELKDSKAIKDPAGYSFTVFAQFGPPAPKKPEGGEGAKAGAEAPAADGKAGAPDGKASS
jgi:type IV pilus assembly protein PilN